MKDAKKTFNAWIPQLAARRIAADPVRIDPALPNCPLCGAGAVAGYSFATVSEIAHACACELESPQAYFAGVRALYLAQQAEPHFVATLPRLYREYTIGTTDRTAGNAKAFDAIAQGITGNLYLYGDAGNGKTRLAVAAARLLAQGGTTARFWGMAELFAALRDSFGSGKPRPELNHWGVLVLDDIDKLKPTDYVYETLYALLESRSANGLITVFTSQTDPNEAALILTPDANARAADPLASRMGSGRAFKITGADRRAGS